MPVYKQFMNSGYNCYRKYFRSLVHAHARTRGGERAARRTALSLARLPSHASFCHGHGRVVLLCCTVDQRAIGLRDLRR